MRIAIAGNYILLGIVAFMLSSDNSHINPRAVLFTLYDYCQDQLELEKKYDQTGRLTWIEQSDYTRNLRHIDALVEVYQIITGRSISCQDLHQQEVAPPEASTTKKALEHQQEAALPEAFTIKKTLENSVKLLKPFTDFYATFEARARKSGAG